MTYYALKDTKKGIKILFATDDRKELIRKAKYLEKSGYVVIAKSAGNIYDGRVILYNWATKIKRMKVKLRHVV